MHMNFDVKDFYLKKVYYSIGNLISYIRITVNIRMKHLD